MNNETLQLRPERIQDLMERRGWDVGILAYKSGVKSNTIYKYLSGSRSLKGTVTNLVYIARALGCSVEYLIGMTDVESPTAIVRLSPTQQAVVRRVGELSERRQRELESYIDLLLDLDAKDREQIKRNLDTNKKLLDIMDLLGGEEAFFDWLDSLGKPPSSDDESDGPEEGDDGDDPDKPGNDVGE